MPRKMTAIALSAMLMLYAYSEPYASPLFLQNDIELLDIEPPAFPDGERVDSAKPPAPPAATGKAAQSDPPRPRFRGKRETAKKQRQKAKRETPSAVANERWSKMRRLYVNRTKRPLMATSRKRTPSDQARVTRQNIRRHGVRYVLNLYRNGPAIREIVRAWRPNRKNRRKAQDAMTKVIEAQVARGVFISDHLRGLAVDVRTRGRDGARMSVLREVARQVGATVHREVDHAHVKLV